MVQTGRLVKRPGNEVKSEVTRSIGISSTHHEEAHQDRPIFVVRKVGDTAHFNSTAAVCYSHHAEEALKLLP